MSLKANLGKRIKELREANFLTQEALADKINIHRNTLSRIENGESFPSEATLEKLINILGVEAYELFNFNSEVVQDPLKILKFRLNELSEKDSKYFIKCIELFIEHRKNIS